MYLNMEVVSMTLKIPAIQKKSMNCQFWKNVEDDNPGSDKGYTDNSRYVKRLSVKNQSSQGDEHNAQSNGIDNTDRNIVENQKPAASMKNSVGSNKLWRDLGPFVRRSNSWSSVALTNASTIEANVHHCSQCCGSESKHAFFNKNKKRTMKQREGVRNMVV